MITITIFETAGAFAENKDVAKKLRLEILLPALEQNQEVVIDFEKVEGATQSFIHALISEAIRVEGAEVLDLLSFKNCNESIKKIITIVTDYMQESL